MKKNVMMRAASALLVAVLLTTCAISGTFAKYVTEEDVVDTARVAKWGVTIESSGGMFGQKYVNVTNGNTVAATDVTTNLTVQSNGNDNVLAPGTKGELAKTTIKGTPEVAVTVTYDATLTLNNWITEGTTEYFPLIIKVNNVTYGISGMKDSDGNEATNKSTTIADLITAVETAIENSNKTDGNTEIYPPNTDLGTKTVSVSWEWAFEGNDDAKDTALGDKAADADSNNDPSISLTIKTTVTQVD